MVYAQQFQHGQLHGGVVDTDGAAAQLQAVQHQVVGARQGLAGVFLDHGRIDVPRRGERVVQGVPAFFGIVVFEQGEVHHPQRRPGPGVEVQVRGQAVTQGTQ